MKKSKWYVAKAEINGEPAYIAQSDIHSFKAVNRRKIRCCGPFSRNKKSVQSLVNWLNQREEKKCT